jgi:hypothetical protein
MTIELDFKPSELIENYVYLRDERTKADATFAAFRKEEFDTPMQEIENKLLDALNRMGTDSLKTKSGTAYKKTSVSVTTADTAEFRRHVIGIEGWELVDWRPNKTAINDLIANGEPLPPGLNRSTFLSVNINRPPKGDR